MRLLAPLPGKVLGRVPRRAAMAAALLMTGLLAGCGLRQEPYAYVDQKEMAGRPGLFTGEPGAFVLLRGQGTPLLGR